MGGAVVGGAVVGGAVVGGAVVGGVPPAHDAPLRVQVVGEPEPVARNPNDADAPGARVPFQERLVKVCRCPTLLRVASQ